MNNELSRYVYPMEDGIRQAQVRTVQIDGEPWFIATDVCAILGLTNATIALESLDYDEVAKLNLGGLSGVSNIISEPGLYSLIMRSRKPEAKHFKRWVTHEVLPTIRKTGGVYLSQQKAEELLANPDLIIGLAQQVKQLKQERDKAVALRDEAIRTKAQISDKKTATAMGKLGGAMNANRILKEKLGISENYKQVRAIEWLGQYFDLKNKGTYKMLGKALAELSVCPSFPNQDSPIHYRLTTHYRIFIQ